MKNFYCVIFFVLSIQLLTGQGILGTVTDSSTGEPIEAVTIELGNQAVATDMNGTFEFKKVKPGEYIIRISAIGYKSQEVKISPNDNNLQFRLERINLFMEPVEIKAIRAGDKSPFTKTNISAKEIQQANIGQDLPFMLNQTPSVVINSDAGNGIGYTGIRIRGSDATRINMTINGIPYNDAESQGLFFVNLPDLLSSVNNIQVQRGVGMSSNGGGAFGATLNFSTNEVRTNAYGEVNNSFGSFNSWKNTLKIGTGLLGDHFTMDVRISRIMSDGFIDRASTKLASFYFSGAWLTQKTSLRFNLLSGKEKTYQAWYGIPDQDLLSGRRKNYAGIEKPGEPYDNETDNYWQNHYQVFFNHLFNNTITFNSAFFLTGGKGYYEQYQAKRPFSIYGRPDLINGSDTIRTTDLIRQLWLDNTFFGQIFSVQYKAANRQVILGGGWNRYNGNHFGEVVWAETGFPHNYRWYDLDANKTDLNIYSKFQGKLSQYLDGSVDLQYRTVRYYLGGFRDNPGLKRSNNYNFFNPKFGVTYAANQWKIYCSYSRGSKEPNRDDFESGKDQQPVPEKLNDFELGIEKKNGAGSMAATLYYMQYADQLILTGKINDVGAYTRINIPQSFRIGLELEGKTHINEWINASGNLSLSRNRIQNFIEYYDDYDNGGQKTIAHGNTDISFSPSIIGSAMIMFTPARNFEISLPVKYVGRQYLDNTSSRDRVLHSFYVQDARLSYAFNKKIFKEIHLIFQVNNLFNKKYEPNGYTFSYQSGGSLVTENYYYPMAGINFMAALQVKF